MSHQKASQPGCETDEAVLITPGSPEEAEFLAQQANEGELYRICENVYLKPVHSRFGKYPPPFETVIPKLAALWEETIVPSGGACANRLGLTTQVPVQPVYLTSGASRTLHFGALRVKIKNAPPWLLLAPGTAHGDTLRAIEWLGPGNLAQALESAIRPLPLKELKNLLESNPEIPSWIPLEADEVKE